YPKMSEYDKEGWHANPYIGREFHGVWGDFDVTIHMNNKYTIGGTGNLQNSDGIGKGYSDKVVAINNSKSKLTWHFVAKNVHDFAWAADPDYTHDTKTLSNGTKLHFFYQKDSNTVHWDACQQLTVDAFEFLNKKYGEYPYAQYTIIQGGDGGMEYPMATLITGHRSLNSLVGVIVHEAVHSWYQGMMATNEALYPWMDEGFTCYAQNDATNYIYKKNALNPHAGAHRGYHFLVKSGEQEPLSTHADHYKKNRTYGISVYNKGEVFLDQLDYVVGEETFKKIMLEYYRQWRFKHPTDKDFKRVAERVSGLELDWYLEQFVGTTNHIDYSIEGFEKCEKNSTAIKLKRIGDMPMPLDIVVTLKDGTVKVYNIPLTIMRGAKTQTKYADFTVVTEDWPWTNPTFILCIEVNEKDIEKVEIDPSLRMSDLERANNVFPRKVVEDEEGK
ncbi:MAG: M1 family metallopeptidase, partial [Flavobacteriales bacterium]